jgi:hypothetical protein
LPVARFHIDQLRADVGAPNRIALAAWAGRHGFDRPDGDCGATPFEARQAGTDRKRGRSQPSR